MKVSPKVFIAKDTVGIVPANDLVELEQIAKLRATGVKFNEDAVVATGQTANGKIVFLESGNGSSGLQHIIEAHGADFAKIGVPRDQIPKVVMLAVTEDKIVGYQGSGTGRPIYQIKLNGHTQNIAVTVGINGYIVGANPAGGIR